MGECSGVGVQDPEDVGSLGALRAPSNWGVDIDLIDSCHVLDMGRNGGLRSALGSCRRTSGSTF